MDNVFRIQETVWEAMSKEEVRATVDGLKEMDLYHLPYTDSIVLQIDFGKRYMEIKGLHDHEEFTWDMILPHSLLYAPQEVVDRENANPDGEEQRIFKKMTSLDGMENRKFLIIKEQKGGKTSMRCRFDDIDVNAAREYFRDGLIAVLASKGLEKAIKQSKLKRLGIGKRSNNYTTTIKLSPSIERGTGEEARPGRPVRPHLRRGHVTNQPYGPGSLLRKKIWIAPVFVNADDGFISTRTAYKITLH